LNPPSTSKQNHLSRKQTANTEDVTMQALLSMDALQCFTSISQNLPSCISRISDLAVYTTTKRAEFELEKLQTRQCNVIIHYDGHIQKELEQVVQKISMAKSHIRKGKMRRKMRTMLSKEASKETLFDFTEKQLDLAQKFCEAAAHQFLRSGDCSLDLEKVQESFRLALEVAESQVERLLKEDKEEEEEEPEVIY
jgi:hypothetical protein